MTFPCSRKLMCENGGDNCPMWSDEFRYSEYALATHVVGEVQRQLCLPVGTMKLFSNHIEMPASRLAFCIRLCGGDYRYHHVGPIGSDCKTAIAGLFVGSTSPVTLSLINVNITEIVHRMIISLFGAWSLNSSVDGSTLVPGSFNPKMHLLLWTALEAKDWQLLKRLLDSLRGKVPRCSLALMLATAISHRFEIAVALLLQHGAPVRWLGSDDDYYANSLFNCNAQFHRLFDPNYLQQAHFPNHFANHETLQIRRSEDSEKLLKIMLALVRHSDFENGYKTASAFEHYAVTGALNQLAIVAAVTNDLATVTSILDAPIVRRCCLGGANDCNAPFLYALSYFLRTYRSNSLQQLASRPGTMLELAIFPLLRAGSRTSPFLFNVDGLEDFQAISLQYWGLPDCFIDLLVEAIGKSSFSLKQFIQVTRQLPLVDRYNIPRPRMSANGRHGQAFIDGVRKRFPRRLEAICRQAILHSLPGGLTQRKSAIKQLELPLILARFLNFEDLEIRFRS